MYLPSSPSAGAGANVVYSGTAHGPHALPVPPSVSANSIAVKNAATAGSYSAYAVSGVSPKRWAPAQLVAHLNQTVSAEAGAWATKRNVGGRAFMKMGEMGEEELKGMGAPPPSTPPPAPSGKKSSRTKSRPSPSYPPHPMKRAATPVASPSAGAAALIPPCAAASPPCTRSPGRSRAPTRARARTRRRRTAAGRCSFPWRRRSPPVQAGARRRPPPLPCGSRPSPRGTSTPATPARRSTRTRAQAPSRRGGSGTAASRGWCTRSRAAGARAGRPKENGSEVGVDSGARMGVDLGARMGAGSGGGQSEGEDDAAGGTVRPHVRAPRVLPARPDGVEVPIAMDLGAVRAYDYVYANGAASIAPGTTHGTNRFLNTNTANGNKELTVEELLGREDALGQPPPLQPMTPSHSGGAWRRGKRGMGMVGMPLSTGGAGDPIKQHPTGGRPLSAHPSSSSSSSSAGAPHAQRTSSGVHAWETDEGAVGSTMKWVPAQGRWVRRRVRIATRRSSAVYSMPPFVSFYSFSPHAYPYSQADRYPPNLRTYNLSLSFVHLRVDICTHSCSRRPRCTPSYALVAFLLLPTPALITSPLTTAKKPSSIILYD
ncbi:hypothetical protein B0H14DRAFT_178573 [Mycena olivaceomarginata]|nr:hypothetical protein B0H14DRAFT_178573 [Mycena olivaceomarginata]